MAEINIKINEISNAISKLQGLQSRCVFVNIAPPSTVGGGRTVNELEDIAAAYKSLNIQLEILISNTISFLQNVRDSYISSDEKAAKGISGK